MTTVSSLLLDAVNAAVAVLPLPAAPTVGEPAAAGQPPAEIFGLLPPGAAEVVVADWEHPAGQGDGAALGVIVGSALAQALAESPMGALDSCAAIQPTLDAAAATAGGSATGTQSLDLDSAAAQLFARPEAWLVPLTDGDGWICATLVVVLPPKPADFVPAPDSAIDADPASNGTATPDQPVPTAAIPRQAGAPPAAAAIATGGLDLLRDVVMEVTVELGRTRMTISELLSLSPGTVVELDRTAGSPADLLVNGTLIARGEVVVVDEDFGIRITEIVPDGAGESAGQRPVSA